MIKSIFYTESFKKGFAVSSLLNFFSKIIAFFNTVAIAYFFGTTSRTDIYFFCISFVLIISSLLIYLDSTILIPEAMRIKEQQSDKDSQRFLSFFLFLNLAICLVLVMAALVNPAGIFSVLSKFSHESLQENILTLYCSIPLLVLMTVNVFMTDILVSYKFFSASAVSTLLNSVFSLLIMLVLHNQLNILSALIGVLIANVLQLFLNLFLLHKRLHWSFRVFPIKIRQKTIHDIFVAQAGNFTTMLTGYVPLVLISSYSSGVLSSINYGAKLADVLTLLITIQFASVSGIKFNELYAQQKNDEIKKTFCDASHFLQFILVPLCIFVFVYSGDIIRIFFGRGAFDANAVSNASRFLKLFILIMPFTAHNAIVARLFMAAQKINKAYIFQIVMSLFMMLIIYMCISLAGPIGFPLGALIFYVVNSIGAIIIMRKNFIFIPYEETLLYTIKCCLLNVPLAAMLVICNKTSLSHGLLFLGTVFVMGSFLLVGLNQKFKINTTVADVVRVQLHKWSGRTRGMRP
jgi:peptidoglycan biosynthesis protein MviN/MurJ (putative lipid II flippase)